MPELTERPTFLTYARAKQPEMDDPMHTAAVAFLTSRPAFLDLLYRFRPENERGEVARDGTRKEFIYHANELDRVIPQFKYLFDTGVATDPVSIADLVFSLPYKMECLTWDAARDVVVSNQVLDHHLPLLFLVQLDPSTVEPAIAEFNRMRKVIYANCETSNELHELFENECVLVTRRPLNPYEAEMLKAANIHHYRLGEDFETFWTGRWLAGPDSTGGAN